MLTLIAIIAAGIALMIISSWRLHLLKLDILDEVEKRKIIPQRAKDSRGRFIKNDPSTPENEAWVDGIAPPKRSRKSAK